MEAACAVDPPGQPPPTLTSAGRWRSWGTCVREGTWSLEPGGLSCGGENPGWLGLNLSRSGYRGLPMRQEGATGDQEARMPANLLHVVWRREHLWQLPPWPP